MADDRLAPPPPPPPALSLRQATARAQRAIREGRGRPQVVEELRAAGLDDQQVQNAMAEADRAERHSVNNLLSWAAGFGLVGLFLAIVGLVAGEPAGPHLFGGGAGLMLLGLPAFVYGMVRLNRMS